MDLELDMARDKAAPARARATVKTLSAALDRDVLADATLLVSELVSNAVKYGKGRIRLRVRARGSRQVLVEVLDEGRGFAPLAQKKRSRHEPGGFGLTLVDRLATSWGVYDATTHVWFVIDRSPQLAPVA
jgi:anti-sigma regulatory factor (Ser/Thr protein kinase)